MLGQFIRIMTDNLTYASNLLAMALWYWTIQRSHALWKKQRIKIGVPEYTPIYNCRSSAEPLFEGLCFVSGRAMASNPQCVINCVHLRQLIIPCGRHIETYIKIGISYNVCSRLLFPCVICIGVWWHMYTSKYAKHVKNTLVL